MWSQGKAERDSNFELAERVWLEFDQRCPSDSAAIEHFCNDHNQHNLQCCGKSLKADYRKRFVICSGCNQRVWITSGTWLHRVVRARAYVGAIYLKRHGVILDTGLIRFFTGVSIGTAQTIMKKIGVMILCREDICSSNKIPTSEFSPIYNKRSTETPAGQHPVAEQADKEARTSNSDVVPVESVERSGDGEEGIEQTESSRPPNEETVLSLLSEKKHFDHLCDTSNMDIGSLSLALMSLEMEGAVVRLPGDWYKRVNLAPIKSKEKCNLQDKQEVIAAFIHQVKAFRQGISRKTVQIYFALFWYHNQRKNLKEDWLFETCKLKEYIEDEDVSAYVSPLQINSFGITDELLHSA